VRSVEGENFSEAHASVPAATWKQFTVTIRAVSRVDRINRHSLSHYLLFLMLILRQVQALDSWRHSFSACSGMPSWPIW